MLFINSKTFSKFLKGEGLAFFEKSASIAKEISADEIYLETQADWIFTLIQSKV